MRYAFVLTVVGFVATPALADGVYLTVFSGTNVQETSNLSVSDNQNEFELEYSPGFVVGSAVGVNVDFGNTTDLGVPEEPNLGLRTEIETAFRLNAVDSYTISTAAGTFIAQEVDGELSQFSAMLNVWVDYDLDRLAPFIGGGAGISTVALEEFQVDGALVSDDSTTEFAYQVGGGAAFEFSPHTEIILDYRYFVTADAELEDSFGTPAELETGSHAVTVGLRYGF